MGIKITQMQLVEIDQKTGGHPLYLSLFAGLSNKMEFNELLKNMPETGIYEYLYDANYSRLSKDEQEVLETISVFRKEVTVDACIQVSKTPNIKKVLISLGRKFLVKEKKNLYYVHDLIRDSSYKLIDNPKEYHKRAGTYYYSLEKIPDNIIETCYHLIKYYGFINDEIIEYLINTPIDTYINFIILDIVERNKVNSPLVFDLLEKILISCSPQIRFIIIETIVKNAELDVDRSLKLIEKIIKDKNETISIREKSISSLSKFMNFRFEKVASIFEEIVDSNDNESLEYICYALKDAGIKNDKTIKILQKISAYDLKRITTECKKVSSDILDDWNCSNTSEIDYLYKLRLMEPSKAIEYLENLMFGSNQFNRFNINYFFLALVLGELYKVNKSESIDLMKRLIENVSGTIEVPWTISRVLLSKEGLYLDTIKDLIKNENFLIRMSGFMTVFQTYLCLNFFKRKYNIQDESFIRNYIQSKKDSTELLELLIRDNDDLLREMAKILMKEIQSPSEPQKLKISQKAFGGTVKGFFKIISPDMLVRFVKASASTTENEYMVGFLTLFALTEINPEKVYPVLKVKNMHSDIAIHIISIFYNEIRKSPENILELLNKFGFQSHESLTRLGAINTSHCLILPTPNNILDIYESMLLNPEYYDRRVQIKLMYALFLTKKWFAFIEDYETIHNSEIDNIVFRLNKLIKKLGENEDIEVRTIADIILNGIQFKSVQNISG